MNDDEFKKKIEKAIIDALKENLSPEEAERLTRNDGHIGLGQSVPGHISIPGLGDRVPKKNELEASSGDKGKRKPDAD